MRIPAIVAAGDRGAARAVYGESKVYLELGGLPLVARTVLVLQQVPEVSEVWVVGDPARLQAELSREEVRRALVKPLHVVPQFRNLYENCWETYRRLLPGAGADGRDPVSEADLDRDVLYLSADLPFATPQEISAFLARAREADCDYALGLVPDESLRTFDPGPHGEPGIHMAPFLLRDGLFRQSNLHWARPARLGHRHYIQDMYEHRYQKQVGNMIALAWRILRSKSGGLTILLGYLLLQLASLADRLHWRWLADRIRSRVTLERAERAVSRLLGTRFRFVATEVGGCAVDIDNEADYDAARARFEEWREAVEARARALHGPPALAATSGAGEERTG